MRTASYKLLVARNQANFSIFIMAISAHWIWSALLLVKLIPVSASNAGIQGCSSPIPGIVMGTNENLRTFRNVTSAPVCCSLCTATDRCVAYNVHSNACHLHNQSFPVINSTTSISGKIKGSSGRSCAVRQGVVFGDGHNVGKSIQPAPEGCCAACRANKECKAWNYHTNTKVCYLHPQMSPVRSDRTSISGVPTGVLPPPPPQPGQYTTGYACTAPDAAKKVTLNPKP